MFGCHLRSLAFTTFLVATAGADNAVDIGNRLELFVDRHLIDSMQDTELRLHHPQPAETVLRFDKPWEGAFCGYTTVIKDGDRFRMYYRGLPRAGRDGTDTEVTCYAESDDGIHWEKPNLGIHELDGSSENNVVLRGQTPASHNFSPFLDANPNVADEQRYKALGGTSAGLIAFVSADGRNWRRLKKEPVFTKGVFDSQNVSFYSETERQYLCYFRTWTETNYGGFRTISRTTSTDFVRWTDPVAMSFGDTRFEHLYTNQTTPYFRAPHIYLSVAARFMPGRQVLTPQDAQRIEVDPGYFGDCSDAVLLSSRGGSQFDRTFMESFIRPGLGLQNWVSRTNYPALGIVPTSDTEISVYLQKNYGQPTSQLQRYTLRTDGFASVHAAYTPGEMITKPLIFAVGGDEEQRQAQASVDPTIKVLAGDATIGDRQLQLHLNFSTSAAGSIQVELQQADGTPIDDYTLEDCDSIIGDRIDRIVAWQGKSEMQPFAGRPVRLRFVIKDADLYSLQIR